MVEILTIIRKRNKPPLCSCGCGEKIIVKSHHKYYGVPKYICGHNMVGHKESRKNKRKASIRMMGENNPSKKLEVREKMSKAKIKNWESKEYSKHMSEVHKDPPEELKKRISKSVQLLWEDPKHMENISLAMQQLWKDPAWRRNQIEKRSGENSCRWLGGISKLPYPFYFDEDLKEAIRERDGRVCQLCLLSEEDLKGYHKKLDVHHIDYNKKNSDLDNLLTLCKKCHTSTNGNREGWQSVFASQ